MPTRVAPTQSAAGPIPKRANAPQMPARAVWWAAAVSWPAASLPSSAARMASRMSRKLGLARASLRASTTSWMASGWPTRRVISIRVAHQISPMAWTLV